MIDYILLALLFAVALLPLALVIWGLFHSQTEKGFLIYMLGTIVCSFGISGIIFDDHFMGPFFGLFLSWLSYKAFLWIRDNKSRKYTHYAKYFLSSIENAKYPSCQNAILSRMKSMIDNTPADKLPKDWQQSVILAVFEISFDSLGSSDYRDIFGELDNRGMQMLHICRTANDRLQERRIISPETHAENETVILQQSRSFYSSL